MTRDRAVFIGGMPRSGTTLMRVVLGAHPDLAMLPTELPLWSRLAPAFARRDLTRAPVRAELIAALAAHPSLTRVGFALDAGAVAAELDGLGGAATAGDVFAAALRAYARRAGKPRWGSKEPRCELHADRIRAELPAAALVHMVRDPRDVLASQRAAWGRRAQHIASTVDDWRRSAALAARARDAGRDAHVAVRYEDLVAAPGREVARVCRALGLAYREEMLDTAAHPLWPPRDPGAPEPAAPGRPISGDRVGRHRRELPAGEVRYVEWRAAREMAAWGYARRDEAAGRDAARFARRLAEEGAWRTARALRVWPALARALGRGALK